MSDTCGFPCADWSVDSEVVAGVGFDEWRKGFFYFLELLFSADRFDEVVYG